LVEKRGWGVRLDLLTFDYEEARKPGSQEKQKLLLAAMKTVPNMALMDA
jgi:hypothetical protein